MAQVTKDYLNSSPRSAETQLGWSRKAIATRLKELETGIVCVDNYRARGRKKTEELLPQLEKDISDLVDTHQLPSGAGKYNSIERCWAALENYWNGAILDSAQSALNWSSNMTWKGKHPTVHLIDNIYPKGITVSSSELQSFQQIWNPSFSLPKWDVSIIPS